MKGKTFDFNGKKVKLNEKEINEIFGYCFRENIKNLIENIAENNFDNEIDLDDQIINNIADTVEWELESDTTIEDIIVNELQEYWEEQRKWEA